MNPHRAFIKIQNALELDATLDCTAEQCDQMFEAIKPIVDKPYTDDDTNWTLLHLACAHGRLEFAKQLVYAGAHVNKIDADRKTPFFLVPESATELKQFLLSHGAIEDPEYFATGEPEFERDTGLLNGDVFRKAGVILSLPFVFLFFVNGVIFAIKFFVVTVVFYYIAAGYFASGLVTKPVWYEYDPKATKLKMTNLPGEWRGTFHDPKFHFGIDFEDVKFKSKDFGDHMISGWYVPGKKNPSTGAPMKDMALVFTHGAGRDRRHWLRHLPMFHDAGYTCLLYDMREHGLSSGFGLGVSYGIRERFDVKAAAEYLKYKRGWKRVGAIGTSVGGAATISGAVLAEKEIDVVVAENPMLTASQLQNVLLRRILSPLFRGTTFSRPIFYMFLKICSIWLNWRLGNIPSQKCQAMHTIAKISPRPLLLMHGTFDSIVPAAHGQKLFDLAHEPKEMWLVPEGHHCQLYDAHPEEWKKRVLEFLDKFERGGFQTPLLKSSASLISLASQQGGGGDHSRPATPSRSRPPTATAAAAVSNASVTSAAAAAAKSQASSRASSDASKQQQQQQQQQAAGKGGAGAANQQQQHQQKQQQPANGGGKNKQQQKQGGKKNKKK